jgi:hypothetical protein
VKWVFQWGGNKKKILGDIERENKYNTSFGSIGAAVAI